ncbi:pentatricopeptide repeat-containing protein At4g38150-like [Humulus lupulus]|uniref:pentatricopeptide repeat-containing protein At4g38150-like n=1 Tax=Humulus lupulus TaxID=3486 RepID=UPI002B4135D4|nr:pentatricopeptide repeat-containing protein At4g38150-like [Humulus lupulus]
MQLLRGNASKLIFSKIWNSLSHSAQSPISTTTKAASSSSHFNLSKELRWFSSSINGDDEGEVTNQTQGERAPQNSWEPKPNRPMRGRAPFNAQSPKPRGRNSEKRENPLEDNSFLERFKLGANDTENDKREQPRQDVSRPPPPVPEDADEIFKKMKETGLIPNAVAMLDGLCKDGLVQEAMKLFGVMREKGTIPEVVIYTAVVDGFCKAQKLDDAIRIFRKMQSNGIDPNAFSYSVLIQGLYKCKRLEEGVEFCIEMLEAGHSPNVTTFVGLVDGLCEEKGVEEAHSAVTNLRQKGFTVNDKAVREFLDKKAPFSSLVWEAIFGKKTSQRLF